MTLGLTKFCGDPQSRLYISRPFTQGDHTWATNGHIMIRIPKRADVPAFKDAPNAQKAWDRSTHEHDKSGEPLTPITPFDIPIPEYNSDGEEIPVAVRVGAVYIQRRYAEWLMDLPGLSIAIPDQNVPAIYFRFDGGDGRLMAFKWREGDPLIADMTTGLLP